MSSKTLEGLACGCSAKITQLTKDALPFRRKLLAMGIIPGAWVTMVQAAPLGDPLEVEVCGTRLCLRRSEAATIDVEEGKYVS